VVGLTGILAVIVLPLKKAFEAGTLTWGSGSFFQDSIVSFVDYSMHYNEHLPRFKRFNENWTMPEVFGMGLIVFWTAVQLAALRLKAQGFIRRIQLVALFQCAGLLAIVFVLYEWNGTVFPYHRTTLLYSLPFVLSAIAGLEIIRRHYSPVKYFTLGLFAFCIWHNSESWNVENTMEWYQNGDAKRVFAYLEKESPEIKAVKKIVVAAEQGQYFSMAFYAETKYADKIKLEFTNFSKFVECDYLFAPEHLKDHVWKGFRAVKKFRHGILYKNSNLTQ
jgi:hypothetical protein